MKKYIENKWWPVIVYGILIILLFTTNYRSSTFITGWDNLHPEFNFALNISRSFFSVWQDHSTGLMFGHTPDFVHQIFLWIISSLISISMLRYIWIFLLIFLGTCGAYKLAEYIFTDDNHNKNLRLPQSTFYPFLTGFFYLFNLATLQTFYAPFEAFVGHFAALPWVLLASIQYWKSSNKRSLIFLSIVLFLATPGVYVPTLFVTYIIALSILILFYFLQNKTMTAVKKTVKLYMVIFIVNAFWLLPFLYFTFTSSAITINSKINEMSTEIIYLQNKEFGDPISVARLLGFWLNNVDPNRNGLFSFMMDFWIPWIQNPLISGIEILIFGVIMLGAVFAWKKRRTNQNFIPFFVLLIISFGVLATVTVPFSTINAVIRYLFPILDEAFRFPYTKFSILTALMYALFFALGIKYLEQRFVQTKLKIISAVAILLVFLNVAPMFTGHLFYDKEKLLIPQEYFQLFNFFKHQDPNTRIANFPQYTFWGWNFYNWGYGGSGFLWYGIRQPILDRAFDVWSSNNENYYWEISNAIYAQNPKLFVSILQKYQITWLVVDKNVYSPDNPKIINNSALEILIKKTSLVKKQTSFGKIDVYELNLSNKMQNFISIQNNLPSSNNYSWGNNDQMYLDHQNYLTGKEDINYFYPFRSLFSNRTQNDLEFKMTQDSDSIIFSSIMPQNLNGKEFFLPAYLQKEIILPATIFAQKEDDNSLTVSADIVSPEIWIDSKKVWEIKKTEILFKLSKDTIYPLKLNINGIDDFVIDGNSQIIGKTFLTAKQDNVFVLSNNKTQTISANYLQSLNLFSESTAIYLPEIRKNSVLVVKFPKLTSDYINFLINFQKLKTNINNCDNFRKGITKSTLNNNGLDFYSKNATSCIAYYDGNLSHEIGYGVFVKTKNIQGKSLHFWVENNSNGFSIIDTYLPENKINNISTFILNPMENSGTGYSMHFDNISIGQEITQNEFSSLALYAIPYNFLTSLVFEDNHSAALSVKSNFSVSHPNESLYIVNNLVSNSKAETLILSQSFNRGWKMYQITNPNWFKTAFPFFFGKEIKDHVLVNNWENGWMLPTTKNQQLATNYIIVFLPQYLEYVGFLFLGVTFLWIIFK